MPSSTPRWHAALDAYEPSLAEAAAQAARFVADVALRASPDPSAAHAYPPRWLTLLGACGCGKTMLARQVFDACRKFNPGNASIYARDPLDANDRRPGCVWMTATEFADAIRRDFGLPEYLGRDFLVAIDDVGAARDTTAFIADGLYRLCNARLGRWTLFTSNLTLGDIAAQIDERVASRMIRDRNVVHRIAAGDYALRKK